MNRWRERWHRRRADAAACAAVALFFAAFFRHVLFGDRFIIAGDALYYSYPLRTVAWDMIRHGQLPLWTPYVLAGYPLLSMAQVAVGYPLTWTYLFLPGQWAEQLYVLAPFLLSPIFTYAYARELGRSRVAALLAGLAFGYGGMMCGFIANSGMLTNSLMWAPLLLLYVDRARTRAFAHCLLRAAIAYALAVLAGHGQSYVYVGALAVCYGLFLSLAQTDLPRATTGRDDRAWVSWRRWQPMFVACGALLLAAGVAAFQLFESLRAARRSVRSALTYEAFGEGSFAPRHALRSIVAPLYHYVDTSAYLAPLALLLAGCAIVCAARGRLRDVRVWFWLAVALVAFLLALGTHTPLYRLVYRVPVLNQFRVPSRHTFEWTFALSILAAYGWDAGREYFARRRRTTTTTGRSDLTLALVLLVGASVIAACWWRATMTPPAPDVEAYTALPEAAYLLWKLAFTFVINLLAWQCWRLRASPRLVRAGLAAATVLLACFIEPAALVARSWGGPLSLPAARLQLVTPATRYLQQFAPTENRSYTRVELYTDEFSPQPSLDAPNLTALYGLHNLAGMEPLILARYSRALGDVGPDSVTPRAGSPPNDDLFHARSHVLDLLNTTHVASFRNLKPVVEPAPFYYGDIGLPRFDLRLNLPPGATARLSGASTSSDTLALVTALANSADAAQGATVARLRLHTADGHIVERELRAGLDTAEWAHERADVRAIIKHELAPVFDTHAGDAADSYPAHRYWARLALAAPQTFTRIEITNVAQTATLTVWRASLYDTQTHVSTPLAVDPRSEFWTTVYDQDGVQIQHNTRACPRAWLVAEVEAVDEAEALRRIRGESANAFDPRRTALLEVRPNELPALPGGALTADSSARVVAYQPNQLTIETNALVPTVLVVSEIFYPGWEATIDGRPAPIMLTDYLLRGVALPAGQHKVEMRYTAPAARTGAFISALTLCLLGALFIYERRTRRTANDASAQAGADN